MAITHGSVQLRAVLIAVTMAVLATGCAAIPAGSSGSANKPSVTIQSPSNGAALGVGSVVPITGSASDTVGVDHVALFADEVSFASTPSAAAAPVVPFSLNWLATPAGPHVLKVVAFRADGTQSDPAVINVVVGAAGSGVLGGLPTLPIVGLPSLPPAPGPSKKPKPSKPLPTLPPQVTPTAPQASTATAPPAATPVATATPTAAPVLTPNADGTAPDDSASEPHEIVINVDCRLGLCATDVPAAALGSIQEQISAPNGDGTDQLFFRPLPNTSYKVQMTACSDSSDQTVWGSPGNDPSIVTGCLDWLVYQYGDTPPATTPIDVKFNSAPSQLYNLYTYTVVQCAYFNCGNS